MIFRRKALELNDNSLNIADRTFISNNELWKDLQIISGTALTEKQKEKVRYYMEHMGWNVGSVRKVKSGNSRKSLRGFARSV